MNGQNFGDLLIDSQDIDMSDKHGCFMFPGGDMIPWLEYLPQDVLNYFGEPPEDTPVAMSSGPGPSGDGQWGFIIQHRKWKEPTESIYELYSTPPEKGVLLFTLEIRRSDQALFSPCQ